MPWDWQTSSELPGSAYDGPGNVREIQNIMERIVVTVSGSVVDPAHLPSEIRTVGWSSASSGDSTVEDGSLPSLEEHESAHVLRALEQSDRVVRGERGAARLLGLPESTLRYRMKKLGLKRIR